METILSKKLKNNDFSIQIAYSQELKKFIAYLIEKDSIVESVDAQYIDTLLFFLETKLIEASKEKKENG